MSLIRRCDICKRKIEDGVEFKHIHTRTSQGGLVYAEDPNNFDICPSCWALLVHDIKAKIQRREEAKETDKMFSEPWDPGVMVATRRE